MSVSGGFTTNNLYSLMNTSLDQFKRASTVAQGYQHYRIKYIKVSVKPTFDTYQTVGGGPATISSKPNLYYMIDKAGAIPTNITRRSQADGSEAASTDEKPVPIGWRPSVLTVDMTAGGVAPHSGKSV